MREAKVSDHVKANYEHFYQDGDSEWRRLGAIGKVDNVISLCGDLPHMSILDIGAGEGSVLKRLSELAFGEKLYALEISPSGVDAIRNKGIARCVECNTFDGYNIPYPDEIFDVAILSHVVEHVEHPRQLIYEAARVAKYLFIEVPLEDTIRLPSNFVFNSVGHINFYTRKSLRLLIQSCNLTVLRQIITNPSREIYTFQKGYKGSINYYVKQSLIKVLPAIATGIFTYHSALICEKNDGPAGANRRT
jgi:ubiquinone/menaquinone biosynthesis C-methylase UbiE